MLPTICGLFGLAPPERPLGGISVRAAFDGRMKARPSPVCFWQYDTRD